MIRIVVTADNHLGRYYARMSIAALETRRLYLRRAFAQVCDYALARHADAVILAGDLFDSPTPRNVDRTQVARRLAALRSAGVPVFGIAGNHDSPRSRSEEGGRTPLQVYEAAGLVTYFPELQGATPQVPFTQITTGSGKVLAVGGFSPNFAEAEGDDPLEGAVVGFPDADLRILVAHCLVEGWVHPDASEPVARRASLEALRGVDLVILGDIHDHQTGQWGAVRVCVPGATEHMDFGSQGAAPGFVDITLDDDRQLVIRHISVTAQPRAVIEMGPPDLDVVDPNASVVARVEAELASIGADALVEVSLAGVVTPEVYHALSYSEVAERLRGRLCHLEWDAGGLRPPRAVGLPGVGGIHRTLADDVRTAVAALIQEAPADDQSLLPDVERELLAVITGREAA